MPKNVQSTAPLHSSHTLEKYAQNPPSQVSTVYDVQNTTIFRCSSWISKRQRNQNQIASIRWAEEKAREFQKNIYLCFTDYTKAFDYVDHNKLWKTVKEMGIPDHLTCLLRNLHAG